MKNKPTLFSAPMVRAILNRRKTQTRRIISKQPASKESYLHDVVASSDRRREGKCHWNGEELDVFKPYCRAGYLLWIKETWKVGAWSEDHGTIAVDYRASPELTKTPWSYPEDQFEKYWIAISDELQEKGIDPCEEGYYSWKPGESPMKWKPSIFMPKWASRITLRVTAVRVERLQDISEEDAVAEGLEYREEITHDDTHIAYFKNYLQPTYKADLDGEVIDVANEIEDDPIESYKTLWQSINGKESWDQNPWVWVIEFEPIFKNVNGLI